MGNLVITYKFSWSQLGDWLNWPRQKIPLHTIMLFVCHPKILHKHCLQFPFGFKMAPGETANNAYAELWGDKQRGRVQDFFFSRGALVSRCTSTPINHMVFFGRIPVVLENLRSCQVRGGGGGGGGHPPPPPPPPPAAHPLHPPPRSTPVCNGIFWSGQLSGVLGLFLGLEENIWCHCFFNLQFIILWSLHPYATQNNFWF